MGNENSQDMCPRCMTPMEGQSVCPKCKLDLNAYTPAKHHLPPRTILDGKYLVGCVLGEGGFGITYVGWDLHLHTMVAIKEYFPTGIVFRDNSQSNVVSVFSGSGEEYYLHDREKFLEEAQMLAKFDGTPGIVNVKNYFKENGTAYIVMEYVQGINLAVLMEQNNDKLPFPRVMKLLEMPIQTLAEMHQQNTYHRDISPENLMVTNDNVVKLIDFGSSKTNQKDKSRFLKVRPGYSPLELYTTGGQEGPYSDIYALSATIYKAVTGITPPAATDRVQQDPLIPPIRAGAKGMSPAQEKALLKGMAVNAQDRFQRMEDLYAALTEAKREKREKKGAEKQGTEENAKARKWIILACAAVLVIVGGFFLLRSGGKDPEILPSETVTEVPVETEEAEATEAPAATKEPAATEEPTEAPAATEAPQETAAGQSAPLTKDMFAEVPELWEAYQKGLLAEEYPFRANALITPEGLSFTREPWITHHEDPDMVLVEWSAEQLREVVDRLYDSGIPIEDLELWDLSLESVKPLVKDWNGLYLRLWNCELKDLPELRGMGDCVASLWVRCICTHEDLSWLRDLPNLEELALFCWPGMEGEQATALDLASITHLGEGGKLRRLQLSYFNLTPEDLTVIAALNLNSLSLDGNEDLEDISPLSGMANLEYLGLCANHRLSDISPLASLQKLEVLNISDNGITEIGPLAELPNLREVYLGANYIADFSPVEHVETVYGRDEQLVALNRDMFSEIPGIWDQFAQVRDIDIPLQVYCAPGRGLWFRQDMIDADEVFGAEERQPLSRQELENLTMGLFHSELQPWVIDTIHLVNWEIESVEPLILPWVGSVSLCFERCRMPEDWSALAQMGEGLVGLSVFSEFDPQDTAWIRELPNLNVLTLCNYGEAPESFDPDFITHLTNVWGLSLGNLSIQDISFMTALPQMRHLYLNGNRISDLSPLADLKNLQILGISNNEVSDLSPLAELTELESVNLGGNHITDFSPVDHVQDVQGKDHQNL